MENRKILEIAILDVDCKIGKDRHFIAADRKNNWRIAFGLFAVIGSAIISSGIGSAFKDFFIDYLAHYENGNRLVNIMVHILPLLVGISTAIVGFLGLEKQTAQHRYVGNAYIEISRRLRYLMNQNASTEDQKKIVDADYEKLLERYLEVNKEGESCPTNNKDSKKAMELNATRRAMLKLKAAEIDRNILGIQPADGRKSFTFGNIFEKGIKRLGLKCLYALGIIRRRDLKYYISSLRVK